jgi:hypothetical protein
VVETRPYGRETIPYAALAITDRQIRGRWTATPFCRGHDRRNGRATTANANMIATHTVATHTVATGAIRTYR